MNRYLALTYLVLATGCGGSDITRVTGSVTMDGEPLTDINVTFWPKSDPHIGVISVLGVSDDGGFDVAPDPKLGPGQAGTYVVMVTDRLLMQAMAALGQASSPSQMTAPVRTRNKIIPKKYTQRTSTPFEVDLHNGANDLEPLEVTSEPIRKIALPPMPR